MTRVVYATGFGPYPGVPDNPSSVLVSRLADVQVLDISLDVSVEAIEIAVRRYHALIREADFSTRPVVLHLGASPSAQKIMIERVANNWVSLIHGFSEASSIFRPTFLAPTLKARPSHHLQWYQSSHPHSRPPSMCQRSPVIFKPQGLNGLMSLTMLVSTSVTTSTIRVQ